MRRSFGGCFVAGDQWEKPRQAIGLSLLGEQVASEKLLYLLQAVRVCCPHEAMRAPCCLSHIVGVNWPNWWKEMFS